MTSFQAIRRSALPAGIALSTLVAMGVTRAHAAGPAKAAITVTPNTGLTDGQHVQVAGSGYQEQQILIVECGGADMKARPTVGPVCSDSNVAVQSDAQGSFPAQDFVVHSSFTGTRYVKGKLTPASHTCAAASDCYVYAYAKTRAQRHARADLSFAP